MEFFLFPRNYKQIISRLHYYELQYKRRFNAYQGIPARKGQERRTRNKNINMKMALVDFMSHKTKDNPVLVSNSRQGFKGDLHGEQKDCKQQQQQEEEEEEDDDNIVIASCFLPLFFCCLFNSGCSALCRSLCYTRTFGGAETCCFDR